jgi:hypothetical protein
MPTREGTINSARSREAANDSFLAVRPVLPDAIPEVVPEDKQKRKQQNLSILDLQKENKKLESLISEMQKRRDKSQSTPNSPVKAAIEKSKEPKERVLPAAKPVRPSAGPKLPTKEIEKLNKILISNKDQKQKEEERTNKRIRQAKEDKENALNLSTMSGKSTHNKSCERARELAHEDKVKLQEAKRKKQETEAQLRSAVVDAKKAHEDRVSKSVSRMRQEKFEAALKIKKEKEQLKEKINESEAVAKEKYRKQKLLVAESKAARTRERREEAPADREEDRE